MIRLNVAIKGKRLIFLIFEVTCPLADRTFARASTKNREEFRVCACAHARIMLHAVNGCCIEHPTCKKCICAHLWVEGLVKVRNRIFLIDRAEVYDFRNPEKMFEPEYQLRFPRDLRTLPGLPHSVTRRFLASVNY